MSASASHKKITALIPCYNEESGICQVIKSFPREKLASQGYDLEILVIDNNSTDATAEVAVRCGARVIHEPKKGKGNAIRTGFWSISADTDYVVMLDGDDTYRPEEVLRLVEILDSGFGSVAIGSRLAGHITEGSMNFFNRVGNWGFSMLVRNFYNVNVTDVLTGYFAWTREAIERLRPHLESEGFAIEMEMITKMARLDEKIYCVPISYHSRAGESNLHPVYDGTRILRMFAKNFFWKPREAKKQRIAFVSDAVMPWHKGGKEKRLYEISKRLVRESREVHIYTMKWWDGPSIIQEEGVYYHALCKQYPLYTADGRRSIYQALMFSLAVFKLLFARFDVLDVDHMPFFPLFSTRIVTWLRGKRLYATWHEVWGREYWMEYLRGSAGIFGYVIEELSFMMPDVIISNSTHTTVRLRAAGFNREIKTIPLGVDLEGVYSADISSEWSDVIFVGRLLSHKNADVLVRAIAIVKKVKPMIKTLIIGDGPEKSRVQMLIDELGLHTNVHVLSHVEDHADLYSLMKASKMLVLPSVREGFGLVAVEANAAGIPVITTSHEDNAAKDLIHEGINGLLSEADPESVAEKILEVLETRQGMKPGWKIEQYDWQTVTKKLEQAFS